jgi:hypothetical protein
MMVCRSAAMNLPCLGRPLGLKGEEFSLRRLYLALTLLAATAVTFAMFVAAQTLISYAWNTVAQP